MFGVGGIGDRKKRRGNRRYGIGSLVSDEVRPRSPSDIYVSL